MLAIFPYFLQFKIYKEIFKAIAQARFNENKKESQFWEDANTIAYGITVPKAIGDFLVLEAIYETNGAAIAIDDKDILHYQEILAKTEGLFVCPEGAATLAATVELYKNGWIKENEKIVLLNTGSGLKYPDTVQITPQLLKPNDELIINEN